MTTPLNDHRRRIDAIDAQLLDLLRERNELAAAVLATKIATGQSIYAPEREQAKVGTFRAEAAAMGLGG